MTDRNDSCEARIAEHMDGRAEDVAKLLAASRGELWRCPACGWEHDRTPDQCDQCDEANEYNEDSIYEFGLGIEKVTILKFVMSTGGPGDWLEIQVSDEGHYYSVDSVTYHFNDWFDHAERRVDSGSPLWELAEWIAETSYES